MTPICGSSLGDAYFHDGAVAGIEEPLRRAAEALNRALALDSTLNVEPMIHLLQIAEMERDTATVRRLINRIPEDEPRSALRRLQAGAVLGDSAMLIAARQEFDSTGNGIDQLLLDAELFGIAIQEAERSAAVYLKRSRPGPGALLAGPQHFRLLSTVGSARRGRGRARPVGSQGGHPDIAPRTRCAPAGYHRHRYAYYGYVDTTAAVEAVARLAPSRRRPGGAGPGGARAIIRGYLHGGVVATGPWRHPDRASGDRASGGGGRPRGAA